MSGVVASNSLLQDRATALQTLLNSSHHLRIFKNNFTPTPANVLADFTEATFTGYTATDLTSQFSSPVKIVDGEWQIQSGTYTYTCSGGSPQTVYGWYIDDGTNVKFSNVFAASINMASGVSFTLQVSPQEWAKSII